MNRQRVRLRLVGERTAVINQIRACLIEYRLIKRLQAKAVGDVGASSITLAELGYGVAKSERREQNRAALDQFLLPLDTLIAGPDVLSLPVPRHSVGAALRAFGTPSFIEAEEWIANGLRAD